MLVRWSAILTSQELRKKAAPFLLGAPYPTTPSPTFGASVLSARLPGQRASPIDRARADCSPVPVMIRNDFFFLSFFFFLAKISTLSEIGEGEGEELSILGQLRSLGGVADGARRPHGETSSSLAPPPGLSTRFLTRWARVSPGSQTRRGEHGSLWGALASVSFLPLPSHESEGERRNYTFFFLFYFSRAPDPIAAVWRRGDLRRQL